ncbi:hypothetical protein E4U32_006374 [Claviceps aff. humidiphila group G2b]|nr:hypothetical protein E4U32_006374 [Claviceps aff. humidiphila group G2b]
MAHARARSADDISSAEFWGLVAEYPAVVEAVSESRTGSFSCLKSPSKWPRLLYGMARQGMARESRSRVSTSKGPEENRSPKPSFQFLTNAVKPGQKTLLELDEYRYGDALGALRVEDPPEMTLAQVQDLVEWKMYLSPLHPPAIQFT